jgi:hypothetical protein
MAKALVGHLRSDERVPTRLALENQRLRRRVSDLEALVLQLQVENERLHREQEGRISERTAVARETEMLPA